MSWIWNSLSEWWKGAPGDAPPPPAGAAGAGREEGGTHLDPAAVRAARLAAFAKAQAAAAAAAAATVTAPPPVPVVSVRAQAQADSVAAVADTRTPSAPPSLRPGASVVNSEGTAGAAASPAKRARSSSGGAPQVLSLPPATVPAASATVSASAALPAVEQAAAAPPALLTAASTTTTALSSPDAPSASSTPSMAGFVAVSQPAVPAPATAPAPAPAPAQSTSALLQRALVKLTGLPARIVSGDGSSVDLSADSLADAIHMHLTAAEPPFSRDRARNGMAWLVHMYRATAAQSDSLPALLPGQELTSAVEASARACAAVKKSVPPFAATLLLEHDVYPDTSPLHDPVSARAATDAHFSRADMPTCALAMWHLLCAATETQAGSCSALSERAVPWSFLEAVAVCCEEQAVPCSQPPPFASATTLTQLLHPTLQWVTEQCGKQRDVQSVELAFPAHAVLLAISSVKPLARAAVHSPLFIGAPHTPVAASALEVENASVLGALLLPSSMPPPALPGVRGGVGGLDASPLALLVTPAPLLTGAGALSAWPNVTRATFMRAMDDTTSSLAAVHRHAVDAVFSILRADATSVSGVHRPNQRAICAWLLRVLRANAARAQEVPRRAISSDAFFLNYGWLLFDLALPIMSTPGVALHSLTCFQQEAAQFTPPASPPLLAAASSTASVSTGGGGDRIAALQVADALLALRRLMASSTLTLEADNPDAVALLDMKFATQVFAYACMALDWGIVRTAGVMSREQRYLAHVGSSAEGGTDMLRSLQGNRIACNLHRQHPHMLATALHFIVCVCEVMGRAYSMLMRGAFPFAPPASDTGSASPPLPTLDTAPASDARLLFPADFITSLAKAVEFIASARSPLDGRPVVRAAHLSDALAASAPGIVHTFVGLLGAPADVLPSPHARAAMGDALYALLLFAGPSERDEGGDDDSSAPTIDRDDAVASVMWPAVAAAAAPACAMHLVPTLMQLYGDVEGTGFYDKTMHRMRVTGLLNALWQERAHAPAFSAGDTSRLVGFANGVIAHATGLLHTALTGLASVRAALRLQTDAGAWAALSDAAREEATRTVTDTGNEVRGSMSLVNESMALLDSLTRDPGMCLLFTRDELVDRFATFLMRNLLMLLGPKGTQLKLDNPGAYNFHSRRLLLQLTKCVLRMSALPRFMRAAAECEVYTPSLCAQAVRIVRRIALLPAEGGVLSLRAFEDFMTRVLDMASAAQDEALIAQDAPAEYQDFMGLMKDPVRAPSGNVFDRTSITQHLLQNPTDPYTRQPLSVEQLEPLPELRAEIDAWLSRELARVRAARAAATASSIASEPSSDDVEAFRVPAVMGTAGAAGAAAGAPSTAHDVVDLTGGDDNP